MNHLILCGFNNVTILFFPISYRLFLMYASFSCTFERSSPLLTVTMYVFIYPPSVMCVFVCFGWRIAEEAIQ